MERKPSDDIQDMPNPDEKTEKGPFRFPSTEEEAAEANDEPREPTADGPEEKIENDVEDEDRFQASDN